MIEGFRIRAVYNPVWDGLDLYFIRDRQGGEREVLQIDPTQYVTRALQPMEAAGTYEPTMQIGRDVLQSLSDALAQQGIRPESEAKLLGRLEATERHLADMRKMLKLEEQP